MSREQTIYVMGANILETIDVKNVIISILEASIERTI